MLHFDVGWSGRYTEAMVRSIATSYHFLWSMIKASEQKQIRCE